MDIRIIHDGNDITSYVVSYTREQKICTGIGIFDFVVYENAPIVFTTWDEVELYEGGNHIGNYFISTINAIHPSATIAISCQDASKRAADYLIVDSYVVDYPSTSRYWIEKFLTEAGVSYEFDSDDTGSLLSNLSALGLMTLYEQMQTLLQMSGWYMHFSPDNVLIIGNLEKDLSQSDFSFNRTGIKSISLVKDDKMLRNRAVVYGGFSGETQQQVIADVSVDTKWNYGESDKRAVLISNSNIPTESDAYELANIALTEFADITKIKKIDVAGHYDVKLGDVIFVSSDVYTGKGIVTTIGTSLSSSGALTHITLDERCPRLFGFFDFGGFVYIGTYGSGVWRKNIEYGAAWANYSEGLDNLDVVDLHVSNGVLACVTADGGAYYRTEGSAFWSKISITNLETPVAEDDYDVLGSGIGGYSTVESGIMARACILDRHTNIPSFVCDTFSGYTPASYSGWYGASGIFLPSGVMRSWLVDYDYYGSGISSVPLHAEDDYSIRSFDVETDGNFYYPTISAQTEFDFSSGYNFGETLSTTYNPYRNGIPEENTVSYIDIDSNIRRSQSEYGSNAIVIKVIDNPITEQMLTFVSNYGSYDLGVVKATLDGSLAVTEHKFSTVPSDDLLHVEIIDSDTFDVYGATIVDNELSFEKHRCTISTLDVDSETIDSVDVWDTSLSLLDPYDHGFTDYEVVDGKIGIGFLYHQDDGGDTTSIDMRLFVLNTSVDSLTTYTKTLEGAEGSLVHVSSSMNLAITETTLSLLVPYQVSTLMYETTRFSIQQRIAIIGGMDEDIAINRAFNEIASRGSLPGLTTANRNIQYKRDEGLMYMSITIGDEWEGSYYDYIPHTETDTKFYMLYSTAGGVSTILE